MGFTLERERFIDDLSKLIKEIEKISESDAIDLSYYLHTILRYYTQATDWDERPELALKNYHHPQKKLFLTVVRMLRHVRDRVGMYSVELHSAAEFNAMSYITRVKRL